MLNHLKDITDREDIKVHVNDLAIVVNNNYPDVRKMLNTIQVSTVENTLKLDNDVLIESNYQNKILEELKVKKPNWRNN